MKLVGLTPELFWSIFGGLAAVIALLYVLKLRRRRVTVPFGPIWNRVLASQETRTWWERLKRLLSMLLQMLLAALIVLAIADPRPEEEQLIGRNLVLLIDTSASMNAIDVSGGVDRLDIARQEAQKVLDSMGPNDSVMLVTMDGQLKPLTPFVKETAILSQQIKDLKTTATPANINQAMRFVRDAVRGKSDPEVYIFTDGAFAQDFKGAAEQLPKNVRLHHVKTGASGQNVAITAFNVRRYISNKQDYEIYVEVRSYFEREIDVELQLYADGTLSDIKPIKLGPEKSKLLFFPDQGFGGKKLEARVELKTADAKDVFPMDNSAYAVLPRTRKIDVLLVTEGNLFLLAPLVINENVNLTEIKPSEWSPEKVAEADVVVFDRFAPDNVPEDKGNYLYVAPTGENSPWQITGTVKDPKITGVKKRDKLVRWMALKDITITGDVNQLKTIGKDKVAATAGKAPMLISRDEGNRKLVAVAFDLTTSDMPMRIALPVLMLNALDFFTNDQNSLVPTYATGKAWSIPVERGADVATIIDPNEVEHQIPVYEGKAIFYGEHIGFHTVKAGQEEFLLASNLADPKESAINPPEQLTLEDRKIAIGTAGLSFVRREYWIYLVLAALALLLLEWLSYNRRWTV